MTAILSLILVVVPRARGARAGHQIVVVARAAARGEGAEASLPAPAGPPVRRHRLRAVLLVAVGADPQRRADGAALLIKANLCGP